jgi:hypothetical protein
MVLIRLAKFVAGFLAVVSLAVLPPDAVADPNVSVLAFGLVSSQSVFESEAKGSAAILARQLGTGNVVARAYTKTRGDVTIEAIKAAIQSAAANMDREHDLLALILTSHGSPTVSRCRPAGASKPSRHPLSPGCSTALACGTASSSFRPAILAFSSVRSRMMTRW